MQKAVGGTTKAAGKATSAGGVKPQASTIPGIKFAINNNARALTNPPFDRRILTLPGPAGVAHLVRGKLKTMFTELPTGSTPPNAGWAVNFLYNPSTISVSHQVTDLLKPPNVQDPMDVTTFLGNTQSTVTWQLLFDRSYEMWDSAYWDQAPGKYGCYVDVRALYGMLQMVNQTPIKGIDLIISPLRMTPVQVYFGGNTSLSYYGRVESLTITYTHWSTSMVPIRCVADITLTIYPKPSTLPVGTDVVGKTNRARQKALTHSTKADNILANLQRQTNTTGTSHSHAGTITHNRF
jgi:hypothetical protein